MKAAVVRELGQSPACGEFPEPTLSAGECRITVTKSRASGAHYSSSGKFPFVAGIDRIGRLDDGSRSISHCRKRPMAAWSNRRWRRRCADIRAHDPAKHARHRRSASRSPISR